MVREEVAVLGNFNALASSLAHGVGDVRGCLILSRDGLVLGAHPAEPEGVTTPARVRFTTIGDPERGFAQFGTETWCYVRRGPYPGSALVGPGARPGLVIDHMDQVPLVAEEGRVRHEGLRGTEVVPVAIAPRSKPSRGRSTRTRPKDPPTVEFPNLCHDAIAGVCEAMRWTGHTVNTFTDRSAAHTFLTSGTLSGPRLVWVPTTCELRIGNNKTVSFTDNLAVLFYSPCTVTLNNLNGFTGQVLGKNVEIENNFTLNYQPVLVPGLDNIQGSTRTSSTSARSSPSRARRAVAFGRP